MIDNPQNNDFLAIQAHLENIPPIDQSDDKLVKYHPLFALLRSWIDNLDITRQSGQDAYAFESTKGEKGPYRFIISHALHLYKFIMVAEEAHFVSRCKVLNDKHVCYTMCRPFYYTYGCLYAMLRCTPQAVKNVEESLMRTLANTLAEEHHEAFADLLVMIDKYKASVELQPQKPSESKASAPMKKDTEITIDLERMMAYAEARDPDDQLVLKSLIDSMSRGMTLPQNIISRIDALGSHKPAVTQIDELVLSKTVDKQAIVRAGGVGFQNK